MLKKEDRRNSPAVLIISKDMNMIWLKENSFMSIHLSYLTAIFIKISYEPTVLARKEPAYNVYILCNALSLFNKPAFH